MEQVSKEMMQELEEAKKVEPFYFFDHVCKTLGIEYPEVRCWYERSNGTGLQDQAKLFKHIYLNEPQFEEKKSKKYIVQALDNNIEPWYVNENGYGIKSFEFCVYSSAFRFDTREEAEKYSTPQSEIIEVED